MKIEELFEQAKNCLDDAKENLDAGAHDGSLAMLGMAYSAVRELMENVWRRKRDATLKANPPGENAL